MKFFNKKVFTGLTIILFLTKGLFPAFSTFNPYRFVPQKFDSHKRLYFGQQNYDSDAYKQILEINKTLLEQNKILMQKFLEKDSKVSDGFVCQDFLNVPASDDSASDVFVKKASRLKKVSSFLLERGYFAGKFLFKDFILDSVKTLTLNSIFWGFIYWRITGENPVPVGIKLASMALNLMFVRSVDTGNVQEIPESFMGQSFQKIGNYTNSFKIW
jgi:hypothetical protein